MQNFTAWIDKLIPVNFSFMLIMSVPFGEVVMQISDKQYVIIGVSIFTVGIKKGIYLPLLP